nr:MAG TPA: hypothetical protein [Caudoviricetes sp.]
MDAFSTYEMVKGIGEINMDKVITVIQWLFGVIVFGLYGGIEFAESWGDVLFNVINMIAYSIGIYLLQKVKRIWLYNKKIKELKRNQNAGQLGVTTISK